MSTAQLQSLPFGNISQTQLESLQHAAQIYACANSLLFKQPRPIGVHPTHVSFCLFPSPFPRDQFEKAVRLQTSYNRLYCNMASSSELIREVLENSIAKVDPFIARLFELWEKMQDQTSKDPVRSSLGIFRNDFLLHQSTPSSPLEIKQIEFNTISIGVASLATKVSDLHRYLGGLTTIYDQSQLPSTPNQALQSTSKALRAAHEHYLLTESSINPVVVLMIVKPNESNIFDQSLIEFDLSSQHVPVRMIRVSCHEILQSTSLDPITKKLFYLDHQTRLEVSVVYYRSMYDPEDFLSEDDWNGRYQLECSRAINCPNLSMQLVGCKKFQQVLTVPKFLRTYRELLIEGIEAWEWNEIQSTWTSMYPLEDPEGFRIASDPDQAIDFVLKPQREGGGNNIYGLNITKMVRSLTELERKAYILMRLIKPPTKLFNYLIKSTPAQNDIPTTQLNQNNNSADALLLRPTEVTCELGIYGFCLLQGNSSGNHHRSSDKGAGTNLLFNFQSGHVLRTKSADLHEGGFCIGISCIDSPLLV